VRPGLSGLLADRRTPIVLIAITGFVVPLVVLLITRLRGVLWSEQPEVWVVERSTNLLFHHGTPYTDLFALGRPPIVDDYTPYGPVMNRVRAAEGTAEGRVAARGRPDRVRGRGGGGRRGRAAGGRAAGGAGAGRCNWWSPVR